ncbi:hypothetical protein GQ600_2473 [Phytophthora cactorum]|nr:hypothetical protein GQ600_2473 [Phytophthora cactorum]
MAEARIALDCAEECRYMHDNNFTSKAGKLRLSSVLLTIGGKAVNPSPIDTGRAQMYVDFRKGRLNREDGAEQVEQHYATLHLLQLLSDESLEHNWDSPSWSEKEILTIHRKMLRDCKGFFETGWLCVHILATLAINDEFNPPPLAAEIFTLLGVHEKRRKKTKRRARRPILRWERDQELHRSDMSMGGERREVLLSRRVRPRSCARCRARYIEELAEIFNYTTARNMISYNSRGEDGRR